MKIFTILTKTKCTHKTASLTSLRRLKTVIYIVSRRIPLFSQEASFVALNLPDSVNTKLHYFDAFQTRSRPECQ